MNNMAALYSQQQKVDINGAIQGVYSSMHTDEGSFGELKLPA